MNVCFVTWYPSCRRSDALAKALGGASYLIHHFSFKQPLHAPFKYILQARDTFHCLRRDGAQLVLVASPPIFAVLTVWAYCTIFRARYIVDTHTGVFDDPRWTWLSPLSRFLARRAATNIVTGTFLQRKVESWGARAVIIGDVPVEFPSIPPADLGPGVHVVVINSFSQDEPLDEILLAARRLPDVRFHVTGNPKHSRNHRIQSLPANVTLTGWLTDDGYAALLQGSHVVMCLTTHDHTMQRGAYEAMALEKPLITSDWGLLRATFRYGTIHVDNTVDEIASAVCRAIGERQALAAGMRRLRRERVMAFGDSLSRLQEALMHQEAEVA